MDVWYSAGICGETGMHVWGKQLSVGKQVEYFLVEYFLGIDVRSHPCSTTR